MDKQQRAIDIIKNYYVAEEQNDLSDMIRSVCSYFDFMKNQELSSGRSANKEMRRKKNQDKN